MKMINIQQRTITITWEIEDVKSLDSELTDEQAWEILLLVDKNHDANIGINWDVLEYYIQTIKGE